MLVLGGLALTANGAIAQQFDGGIPATWTCTGNCGTSADVVGTSVVTPLPTAYGWVSTSGGIDGVSPFSNTSVPGGGGGGAGSTNGSLLRSTAFSATAGEVLQFQFNYVTSDGGTFADYGWARLLNAADLSEAAILFTARTNEDTAADVIPGFGLPNPNTTLTPASVPIIDTGYSSAVLGGVGADTGPQWSPLGTGGDGKCYHYGCGYTGWVGARYNMAATGNYVLEFGVTNWDDNAWDSGMAFNSVVIGTGTGQPGEDVEIDDDSREVITAVPEPETYAMLLAGLGLLGFTARRRKQKSA